MGLSDGFVIHAAASQKANPAHEPASEAALEQQAASPITLLSQQVGQQLTWKNYDPCPYNSDTEMWSCRSVTKHHTWYSCRLAVSLILQLTIVSINVQEGFYNELPCLGDACRLPGVQQRIKHMLGMLPTDPRLLEVLRTALGSEHPAEALKPLLEGSAVQGSPPAQPTRLLYTLEVC